MTTSNISHYTTMILICLLPPKSSNINCSKPSIFAGSPILSNHHIDPYSPTSFNQFVSQHMSASGRCQVGLGIPEWLRPRVHHGQWRRHPLRRWGDWSPPPPPLMHRIRWVILNDGVDVPVGYHFLSHRILFAWSLSVRIILGEMKLHVRSSISCPKKLFFSMLTTYWKSMKIMRS